jgi:hypothetical protein
MAAEVCADCGKTVSVGLGVLMERRAERPGIGKGVARLVLEKRHQRAENESGR